MGLIRKSLAVGSLGAVHGSSKKQRVAKATMRSSAAIASAACQTAQAAAAANRIAEQRANDEREFRYATDPVYRKWLDDKRAAEQSHQRALTAQQAAALQLRRDQVTEARKRRRDRNMRIRDSAVALAARSAVLCYVVAVMVWLPLLVWVPQIAVGKFRKTPVDLWMRSDLKAMSAAKHSTRHR